MWCVVEIGYEYNDEYYNRNEDGGGIPLEVYNKKENAEFACSEKNKVAIKKNSGMTDGDGDQIKEFYKIVEVATPDEDLDNYDDYKKQTDAINIKKRGLTKEVLLKKAKLIFDKHPALSSFGWTQYTPYFNDGEACYFGVQADEP
jgi:hypothetical protein